jgi:hypothetical protein
MATVNYHLRLSQHVLRSVIERASGTYGAVSLIPLRRAGEGRPEPGAVRAVESDSAIGDCVSRCQPKRGVDHSPVAAVTAPDGRGSEPESSTALNLG